ncbi:MAG: class I SAM-dependent methyltransferase [Desulfobacterales bacterium]|nr:class I SAM-dependent methyltransferase [Desulfobacterales bacterium]
MDESSIINTYKRYAGSYDKIFGRIFEQGRKTAVAKMGCCSGDRVLEVGIGTGLALTYYPEDVQVYGIDISPDMLGVARENIAKACLSNICLSIMDAQKICFPDNYFDKISAMYVATVVPDPQLMMDEIKRVCKPDGDLFILNHFSNNHFFPSLFETMLTPLQKVLGFRPRFSKQRFIAENALDVMDVTPVNLFGYWTLIHAKNRKFPVNKPSAS